MSLENLKDLFVDELKDLYDAEQRLTKAIPKLAKTATAEKLVAAFEHHLRETEEHVVRLESIFDALGETPKRKTCKAMVGLLEEGQELMDEDAPMAIKDLALIAAAQKVEHYEMATYGCMRTWAELLGESKVAKLLQRSLDEEGTADRKLTEIALSLQIDSFDAVEDEDEEVGSSAGTGPVAGARKRSPAKSSKR